MVFQLLGRVRAAWRPILQVHLIFTLLGIVVLGPLFGILLQMLLELSGTTAVSDEDIALLFVSPGGIASGLILATVFLAINALEIGALLAIAMNKKGVSNCTPTQATVYAFRRSLGLLRLTLSISLRVLLYLMPFLVLAGGIAWYLLTDYDINFYLAERPPQFLIAVLAAGLIVAGFIWVVGRKLLDWCLALPLVLFADRANTKSLGESERLTLGRRPEILRLYLSSLAAAGLIALVPLVLFKSVGGWLVEAPSSSLTTLVLMLGALVIIWLVMNFFIVAFALATVSFTTVELYDRLGPSRMESQPALELTEPRYLAIRWTAGRILFCMAAAAVVAGLAGKWLLDDIQTEDHVEIIAHRGAAGSAPENTLAAVRRAIADGSDWVEIDVQESKDGQVVVIHDSDFMKLAGNPLKVWDGELAELQALDIGSWFDPVFAAERVPTLEQVLDETRGRAGLIIELKYYGHDQQLEQRVVDIVESKGMANEVMIMSLKLPGVRKLQVLRPQWKTGLLAATALGDLTRTDVDFLAVSQRMVTSNFIKRSHGAGKTVMVWTVNDPLSMSKWMSMGVDGIITDEPALAARVLAERSGLNSAQRLVLRAALLLGKPVPQNSYRDNSP